MLLVAVRRYDLDDVPAVDLLYRRGASYAIHQTGGGEPDSWHIVSRLDAGSWLANADETLTVMEWPQ